MVILTVNAGSSSVRLAVFGIDLKLLASEKYDTNKGNFQKILSRFLDSHSINSVAMVSHRIVHGGSNLEGSCLIDKRIESKIKDSSPLAPLHNPVSLEWIQVCRELLGKSIHQVGVFDTAFFNDLPPEASTYAIPVSLVRRHGLKRLGFHGIAHRAMVERWGELDLNNNGKNRVISIQLGSGCSMAALQNGIPVDTSMGMTPLEGLVMATRPGDIDPGILTYLMTSGGLSVQEIDKILNESSGLQGISGISGDMKGLLESPDANAKLAVDIYCYRVRKYIGAYMAVLGGLDALLFGGGVGENAPIIREKILESMEWVGIEIDKELNYSTINRESCISKEDSEVLVWVIPVDEEIVLVREALAVINEE